MDPRRLAHRIADAVDEAWHGAHGSGDLEVPLSVVAALSFLAPRDDERPDAAKHLVGLDIGQFTAVMRSQWRTFAIVRPDLVVPALPLVTVWHGEHAGEADVWGAKRVADAAVRAGQLDLTGTDRRADADLLGAVLTVLRSRSDRAARGQFYTPADACDLIARIVGTPSPGESVCEPAAGTGGMLRAVAKALRDQGRDPALVRWFAVDTDPLAVACLAVNAVLWNLGPRVLLGVGNGLTDEWLRRAAAQRREMVELTEHLRKVGTLFAALNTSAS